MDEDRRGRAIVSTLLRALNARAAGLWRVESDALVQVCFVPAADLSEEVGASFASATRAVSLQRTNLGIVQACLGRLPAVSQAEEADAEGAEGAGSAHWLRAFGAVRSIAVPLFEGESGPVRFVLAVALADSLRDDDSVAAAIRNQGRSLSAGIF